MDDMGITDHQKSQLTTAPAKKGGKKQEEKAPTGGTKRKDHPTPGPSKSKKSK